MAGNDLFASSVGLDASKPVAGTDLFLDPNAPGPFKRGLKSGLSDLKSTAGGALALAGDVSGIQSLQDYGLDVARNAQAESAKTGMRAEDVHGVGEGIDYAKYGAGYLVPQLAIALTTGLLGRGGGALAARGLADPAKALIAKNAGMVGGLAASSIAQEAGSIYPDAVDAGLPDAAARSVVGGTLAGSLDVVPELLAAKMLGMFGRKALNPAKGLTEILKGGAKGAAAGIAVEGGTELAQTGIERVAAGQPLTDEEAQSDYLNSALLGAIGGGLVGGPVGAAQHFGHAAPASAAAPAPVATAQAPVEPAPVQPTPDTSATGSPFEAFNPADLRMVYDFNHVTTTGAEDHPITSPLDQVNAHIDEVNGRISALTEEKADAKTGRTKQAIAKDRLAAQADLATLTQKASNLKTLEETPDYQPKARTIDPTIIGEGTPEVQVQKIITPQEDEILRLAEKEDINAARQGNFKTSIQQQRSSGEERGQAAQSGAGNRVLSEAQGGRTAGRASSFEGQVGLIKRGRGLLLSEAEAKAVREFERTAPAVATSVGGKPRSVAREQTSQSRQENFVNAYSQGVDNVVGNLVQTGAFSPETATSIGTALKRAVESSLAKPDAPAATEHFNTEFAKALKGKLPAQDIETFRNDLTQHVSAALTPEIAEPGTKPLRSTKPVKAAAGLPKTAAQQTLFNKGAVAPTVEFTHWGDVPGGTTNPGAMGTGVRGADWPLAQAMGLSYTSAVVKGSTYREPAVQGRQQYEGSLDPAKVYQARSDDPLLAQARQQVAAQFGPHEGIAWMQYAKNVRDMGYDAMQYANGQLRIFTPQAVQPVSTSIFEHVLPTMPDKMVYARAKEVLDRHLATGGSSTYIRSGRDAAGTSAYAVSVFKQREVTLPGNPNTAALAQYIRANDDLLSNDTYLLGTWYDADTNQTYLDISRTTPDMRTALGYARAADQKAIFDLRTLTTINLGHPLFDVAQVYNSENGLPPIQELEYIQMDPAVGKQIARAYDQLQALNRDETVKEAFDAMALEEEQMFAAVSQFIKIEPWTKEGQPYDSSAAMRADVFGNNHLWVFQGGEAHPYRTPEQVFKGRAVHDLFAHARTGFEFGPTGELNATRMHAQMYSHVALPALVVDNIGQNSWVNFSDVNEGKPQGEREFAAQKVDLLPESLWGKLLSDPINSRSAADQRTNDVHRAKGEQVFSYLEHILGTPRGLTVQTVESLPQGVGALRLSNAKAIIELALNAKDIMSVAGHEGYHYLESTTLPARDREVVRAAFAVGTPLHTSLIEKTRAYDKANGTNITEEVQSVPAEARAYGFEFWKRGDLQAKGVVQRVFEAFKQTLERISNFVNGLGWTSYEDIFNGIERGDYARRELQNLHSGTMQESYVSSIEPDAMPGSTVLNRNKDAASQAKGRPAWIKTPQDLKKMRSLLKGLVTEGGDARNWYRRSAQAILAWAGGDKAKAGKMAALVAMYSPRTPVGEDLKHAVQHYVQWERGQKIDAGGSRRQAEYGSRILDGTGHRDYADMYTLPGNPETAPKITSFFKNMMLTIDPVTYNSESQDATIDMWMSHIFGFGSKDGKISDANYWWADAEVKRLANQMGLATDQVQAAVWVAIKARGNMVRSLARKQGIERGWFTRGLAPANERTDLLGKGGRPTVYKLKPKHEFDYMVNWIRLALSAPFSRANFDDANYSYAEGFRDIADGSLRLNRLDTQFELDAGLFNDIAFGKVTQGEMTFYSRAASLADIAQRVDAGELPRQQLNAMWADAVDQIATPADIRESFVSKASTELTGAVGGLKRFYAQYLSSGLNLARHSAGYKNAFNVMTAYTQRKSRLIADSVERQLSTWTGSKKGTQTDKIAASKALLLRTENAWTTGSEGYLNVRNSLTETQREMFDQATAMIGNQLDAELKADSVSYRKLFTNDEQFQQWYSERFDQVQRLKAEGYFPERRYGDHIVHGYVAGQDGKHITVYYSQHEREADARGELANLQKLLPNEDVTFDYGYRFQPDYDGSLSFQQFLNIAGRHGIKLTQAEKERIGKALIAADSTRRNRIFRRKNIAGYSEDGTRVLAEFGVTMANKIAYSELGEAMNDAANGKETDVSFTPDGQVEINTYNNNVWQLDGEKAGFYRNLVDKTLDFTMAPNSGNAISRGMRTAASVYFLGGSASAAMVNMTALAMNTLPWLTQHTSYSDAAAKLTGAAMIAGRSLSTIRDLPKLLDQTIKMEGIDEVDGLRRALQIATQDGTVLDTEIYQIMGLSRGQEYSLSGRTQNAVRLWMTPFRLSEQFNRVTAFIATYKIAKENKATNDAAYKLAQDAVYSTHFRYDEANRPAMARGPVGSLLFTFKTYPIFAAELMAHLFREKPQAGVYMMLSFALMAGIDGLPFSDDIADIIDVISQRVFGSPFNTKRAMRNVLKQASESIVGADLSSVMLHGIANELTGLSFSSRVGLGNMIPGTRIGAADADYKKVVNDLLGPVGSLITSVAGGLDSVTRGNFDEAAKQALPLAARNMIKGWEQFERGYATDVGGRRLVDVSGPEAFWQSLGFSSSALANAYTADSIDKQTLAFYNQVKVDFSSDLAKALREKNTEKAADVAHTIAEWNKYYPNMPIAISPSSIRRQIQLANLPLNQRTLLTLPRQLRGSSDAALGLERN
jgi:hypothetical protein